MSLTAVHLIYLLAAVCFVFGLKQLASPKTAPRGNWTGAVGMLLAVVVTLFTWTATGYQVDPTSGELVKASVTVRQMQNLVGVLIAIGAGTAVGAWLAKKVEMTQMPQLVAIFNGLGGLASALVALGEIAHRDPTGSVTGAVGALGILIGGLTFTGSVIAFGKLQGLPWAPGRPVTFPLQKLTNAMLLLFAALCVVMYANNLDTEIWVVLLLLISLCLGVMAVIPIGGADMPVVIALLNSYSGIAGSAAGYAVGNPVLIVAGALVGASGIILTMIMCRAMNRSLANVLFGAFGTGDSGGGGGSAGGGEQKTVRNYTPEDAAILLGNAQSVIIVPGYGLAVAQAQHNVRELCDLLEERGVDIKYAVHPVAGRMPGHMNVLLAEANVPYEQLMDMDEVNPYFESADVALVVGANDVVNPGARYDKDSPIYGMPILDADKAANVIILKRSLGVGFAGTQNPLFFEDKTMMLFGDAKDTVVNLVGEVKAL